MIVEIELKQPKLKYPNRVAQLMRNSPYLSQFDGDQSFIIWDFFPVKCLRHIELSLPTTESAIFEENFSQDE